jgi:hypothetical protein
MVGVDIVMRGNDIDDIESPIIIGRGGSSDKETTDDLRDEVREGGDGVSRLREFDE